MTFVIQRIHNLAMEWDMPQFKFDLHRALIGGLGMTRPQDSMHLNRRADYGPSKNVQLLRRLLMFADPRVELLPSHAEPPLPHYFEILFSSSSSWRLGVLAFSPFPTTS